MYFVSLKCTLKCNLSNDYTSSSCFSKRLPYEIIDPLNIEYGFYFRISYIASSPPSPSRSPLTSSFKPDPVKDENHKRELSTLRKRLADAENTIRRLEWQSLRSQANTTRSTNGTLYSEVRRMETEVRSLRSDNEKLEEKLRVR